MKENTISIELWLQFNLISLFLIHKVPAQRLTNAQDKNWGISPHVRFIAATKHIYLHSTVRCVLSVGHKLTLSLWTFLLRMQKKREKRLELAR